MSNRSTQTTTTSPLTENNFVTTSRSLPMGGGVLGEVRLGRHLMWRVEAIHQGLKYDKVNNMYTGSARNLTIITERTKATTWEIPAMLQFRPAKRSGLLKNIYFAGGGCMRKISSISTGTSSSDTNDSGSSVPVVPTKKNLFGAVAAVGFRFIDDFRINVTPEIRYIRWAGSTFRTDSTQSPTGQLEAGFAFTF